MESKIRIETMEDLVEVHITGKLTREMYETFVPAFEDGVRRHGKLRVLFVMQDFHGWSAGALWDDLKFDLKHFNHILRLAIVGETKWEKDMAVFCKPFTTAKVKYFPAAELDTARRWLREEPAKAPAKASAK